jgi:hypothetical protein
MTDTQLYLAIGIPVIINLMFNGFMFLVLWQSINRLWDKLDLLTTKVVDIDNRVTRIEDKLGLPPH